MQSRTAPIKNSRPPPESLIRRNRDAQHHRLRTKIETPVCLVAIPDAQELEGAVFVSYLFYTQELPMSRLLGRLKVDTSEESRHQELVVFELGHQHASGRLRIPHGRIVAGGAV